MTIILMVDCKTNTVIRQFSKQLHIPLENDQITLKADEGDKEYVVVGRRFAYSFIGRELLCVHVLLREGDKLRF